MGHTNLRHSLEKKFAALTGELEHVRASIIRIRREQAKIPQLEAKAVELEELSVSAAKLLKSIAPDWTPDQTDPLKPWTHTLPVPFGSCGRRAMEVLRCSDVPMTARELALEVLRQAGQENADIVTVRKTVDAVQASLRAHSGDSVESSGKYPAQWRSIVKPEVEFDV